MEKLQLPEGHQLLTPYVILDNAGAFFQFAQTVFDAEETYPTSYDDQNNVRHANLNIGGSQIMYCNSIEGYPAQPVQLFIYVKDSDATFQKALDAGATIVSKIADLEYGRSGGVLDPFGNTWWITTIK